jgi:hypothetical protein
MEFQLVFEIPDSILVSMTSFSRKNSDCEDQKLGIVSDYEEIRKFETEKWENGEEQRRQVESSYWSCIRKA